MGMETLLRSGDLQASSQAVETFWDSALKNDTLTADWQEAKQISHALFLGWHRCRYQQFLEDYEILEIEKEIRVPLAPNIVLMAKADATVRDRRTGLIWVYNWKTQGDKKDFASKWANEVQMWTEALAMQDYLGERVEGCIAEGFYKGTLKDGAFASPLVRAWENSETGERSYTYRAGKNWLRVSAAQGSGGLTPWIAGIPEDILSDQFMRSQPIIKNDKVVRDWLAQVVRFETDTERVLQSDVSESDRLTFFRQNWSNWNCNYCPFNRVCLQQYSIEDLLELGLLRPRDPHHDETPVNE
jgi:hypothetical protein